MLTLRALGSFDVRDADGRTLDGLLSQPKRAALLAYLALSPPGELHRRDTLLALFWPDLDQSHGRRALSQALSFLRRELGEGVLVTRGGDEVGVDSSAIRTDVAAFAEALSNEDWRAALEEYRGDLLRGVHVAGAATFVDWVDRKREPLRRAAAGAAWQLAHECLDMGAPMEAEQAALRARSLVPTDESPVRAYLLALGVRDRAAAIQFYETWAALLDAELGLDPSEETRAIARDLRDGSLSTDEAPPPQGVADTPSSQRTDSPLDSAAVGEGVVGAQRSPSPDERPAERAERRRGSRPTRWVVATLVLAALVAVSPLGLRRQSTGAGAAPGFTSDDWLLAADFQAPADQPDLGVAFAMLVIQDIESSGYAGVVGGLGDVSRTQLGAALERMRVSPDTPMDVRLALELAQREGAAGVLTGQVLTLGNSFVLSLEVLSPDGRTLLKVTDRAGPDELPAAAERMSHKLRKGLGESRRSIRASSPLPALTTASLEALKLYQRALQLTWGVGVKQNLAQARALAEAAVERDPEFAMAHAGLGALYLVHGDEVAAARYLRRAYELRSDLPRRERLHVEALYQRTVESDPRKAAATWEEMIREFPDTRDFAIVFLSVARSWYGDWQGVLELAREFTRVQPGNTFGPLNAWIAAWELGDEAVADTFRLRYDELAPKARRLDLLHQINRRDWSAAETVCRPTPLHYYCGLFFLMRGEARRAATAFDHAEAAGRDVRFEMALLEHLRGNRERGLAWLARNGAVNADSLARPGFHWVRFLRCGVGVVMGVTDVAPACLLEGEHPGSWDDLGSYFATRNAGAWSWRLLALRGITRGDMRTGRRAAEIAVRRDFGTPWPIDDLIRGWRWDVQERPDSALVAYRAAARPGYATALEVPLYLGLVYRRVGELSEAVGDTTGALEAYQAFVGLWAEADAEVQPQVKDVRKRIERLRKGEQPDTGQVTPR